jgi:hypothetical protein
MPGVDVIDDQVAARAIAGRVDVGEAQAEHALPVEADERVAAGLPVGFDVDAEPEPGPLIERDRVRQAVTGRIGVEMTPTRPASHSTQPRQR